MAIIWRLLVAMNGSLGELIAYLVTLRHRPFACCITRFEAQQLAFHLSSSHHPRQVAVIEIPMAHS
jgi:hypothetical protein